LVARAVAHEQGEAAVEARGGVAYGHGGAVQRTNPRGPRRALEAGRAVEAVVVEQGDGAEAQRRGRLGEALGVARAAKKAERAPRMKLRQHRRAAY
jgi:hypothetical protein